VLSPGHAHAAKRDLRVLFSPLRDLGYELAGLLARWVNDDSPDRLSNGKAPMAQHRQREKNEKKI